jgi:hypothetical protein
MKLTLLTISEVVSSDHCQHSIFSRFIPINSLSGKHTEYDLKTYSLFSFAQLMGDSLDELNRNFSFLNLHYLKTFVKNEF